MKPLIPLVASAALMTAWGNAVGQPVLNPPAAASAPAPAVLPPTQAATAAVSVLQNVCLPLLQGGKLDVVGPKAGLRQQNGGWVLPIDSQRRVEIVPPDAQNPGLCGETITHRAGAEPAIYGAVDRWAKAQSPALQPVKVDSESKGTNHIWLISSWSGQTPKGSLGLVLTEEKTLTDQPIDGTLSQSTLLVNLTPS